MGYKTLNFGGFQIHFNFKRLYLLLPFYTGSLDKIEDKLHISRPITFILQVIVQEMNFVFGQFRGWKIYVLS